MYKIVNILDNLRKIKITEDVKLNIKDRFEPDNEFELLVEKYTKYDIIKTVENVLTA